MNELEKLVEELNNKYCLVTKNHLVVRNYLGNTQVSLTGKDKKTGLGERFFGITNGFGELVYTLRNLQKCEETGWLRAVIQRCERRY